MGQQQSHPQQFNPNSYKQVIKTKKNNYQGEPRIEHQGILKLRELPFRNSIQICSSPPLFLQSSDSTLQALLQARYNTTKLFTEVDILKLLQSTLYTLTFLQTHRIYYTDLTSDNIFYDSESGNFKLLPLQLIKQSSFELAFHSKRFSFLSPQLIIALRYGQRNIQHEIYHKSNVFALGMLLLQVSTLRPSKQCYDEQSYDILDHTITERLDIIKQFYPEKIHKFISLMLEYDYSIRLDPKKLSILVNRELGEEKLEKTRLASSYLYKSRKLAEQDHNIQSRVSTTKPKSPQRQRTSLVYNHTQQVLQNQEQFETPRYNQERYPNEVQKPYVQNKKSNQIGEQSKLHYYNKAYNRPISNISQNKLPSFARLDDQREEFNPQHSVTYQQNNQPKLMDTRVKQPHYSPSNLPYQHQSKGSPSIRKNQSYQEAADFREFQQNPTYKQVRKSTVSPQIYRTPFSESNERPQNQRQYSPYKQNLRTEPKYQNIRGQAKQDSISDSSISRIKEQIERSRKLILDFQRNEGISENKYRR